MENLKLDRSSFRRFLVRNLEIVKFNVLDKGEYQHYLTLSQTTLR